MSFVVQSDENEGGVEKTGFVSDLVEDLEEAVILMYEVQVKTDPRTADTVYIRDGGRNGEIVYGETYTRSARKWKHNPVLRADPRVLAAIIRVAALDA